MVALVKWNIHWTGAGEEGETGFYCTPGGVNSLGQLETAVSAFIGEFVSSPYNAHLRAQLSTDQRFDKITGYYYPDALAAAAFSAEGTIGSAQGVGTGTIFNPLQNSIVATLKTGHSGASYRGRMYFPLTGMAPSTSHQMTAGFTTQLAEDVAGTSTTFGLLWDGARALDSAGTGGSDPVVFSRKLNLATVVTSVTVDSRVDIQRRRADREVPTIATTRPYEAFTG